MNYKYLVCVALLNWVSLCATAEAHPFHISVAEMERNPQSKRIEVSLKLHGTDIEQALGKQEKRRVDLEKDPRATQLLTEYLQTHFFATERSHVPGEKETSQSIDPQRARTKVHFIGQEFETTWLWLYFEIEILDDAQALEPASLVLVNSVLLDVTEGQINTVTVRHARKRYSLRMTAEQPWAALPLK